MHIVWDEPKREANVLKHSMNFADLDGDFFEGSIVRPGHSERYLAIGMLDGQLMTVMVFRALGNEALSVISMRPASASERKLHDRR